MADLRVVETLYETNCKDISGMLRKLADDIDAGKYGDVSMVLPVMLRPSETGEAVELFMFGSGYDRNRFSATGLLTAAIFALNN